MSAKMGRKGRDHEEKNDKFFHKNGYKEDGGELPINLSDRVINLLNEMLRQNMKLLGVLSPNGYNNHHE